MAAVNINNEQQISFHHDGATVEIIVGSDTLTVMKPEPESGSIGWDVGGREKRMDMDRAAFSPPLLGKDRLTKLKGKFRYTSDVTAQRLEEILTAEAAGGLVQEYTWVIRIPAYKDATTGVTITFANCSLAEGSLKISTGEKFDGIEFELDSRSTKPVKAAYL